METHNGVKGDWKDITRECGLAWFNCAENGAHVRVTYHGQPVVYMGATCEETPDLHYEESPFRVTTASKGNTGKIGGKIKIEHFGPAPPEYGWVDVTKECTVDLDEDEAGTVNVRHPDREIRLVLHGNRVEPWAALDGVGFLTEEYTDEANSYRVTSGLESFTVEHYQEIE